MAKKQKPVTAQPETQAPEVATETVGTLPEETKPASAPKKTAKKSGTLEADELAAVGLERFQCPRCKSVNSEQNVTGTPYRTAQRGFHDGREYSIVTRSQVFCGQCGGTFIQSDYE